MAVGSVEVVRDYDLKSKSIGVRMSELGSESGGAPLNQSDERLNVGLLI